MGLSGAAVTRRWFTLALLLPSCRKKNPQIQHFLCLPSSDRKQSGLWDQRPAAIPLSRSGEGEAGLLDKDTRLLKVKETFLFQHAERQRRAENLCVATTLNWQQFSVPVSRSLGTTERPEWRLQQALGRQSDSRSFLSYQSGTKVHMLFLFVWQSTQIKGV